MAQVRGSDGRFIKGKPGGPGRKSKAAELPFLEQLKTGVTPEDFGEIVQKLVAMSKRGNLTAISMLFDHLLGKPVQKQEVSGAQGSAVEIVVRYEDRSNTTEAA